MLCSNALALEPVDERLLGELADHVAVVADAVRLAADLQHSRERLVTASEDERRRLGRDLHDGLGPALAGVVLSLDAPRHVICPDAGQAVPFWSGSGTSRRRSQTSAGWSTACARHLDELGLVGALQAGGGDARGHEAPCGAVRTSASWC